jgi:adenosylmethionine-8-amino-7-oxononanoate aminotransferase
MEQSLESNLLLHRTSKAEVEKGIITLAKGDGIYLEDTKGNRYVDMVSGITRPVSLGYGCKEIAQACYDQIMTLAYATPCGRSNVVALELAAKLANLAPANINHFTFDCSGSEAVESAMKLARLYHNGKGNRNRYKIISRIGAYHGVNGLGLRALGVVQVMRHVIEPVAPGGIFVHSPYCYRCPFGRQYPGCDLECAKAVEEAIQFESPELVSAFIGEPVQQGFGSYAPPKEYWNAIRAICDKYDVLLIDDEVICGFGRTGKMFAAEHFDLQPDLMTMAKCLTSGYVPLGGVGISDKVHAAVDNFIHLHTYGNHPVSCAAALATIAVIKRDNLVQKSSDMGTYLLNALHDALKDYPSVGEIRGLGLWVSVDFTSDKKKRPIFPATNLNSICDRALAYGYMIKSMGSAVELAPPFIITPADIDAFVHVFAECIREEEQQMGLRK